MSLIRRRQRPTFQVLAPQVSQYKRSYYAPSQPTWELATLLNRGSKTLTSPYQQHAWVYACVKAIATNIASVPWLLMQGSYEQPREVTSGPWHNIWTRPNPLWNQWHLIEATSSLLDLQGNAIWVLKRDGYQFEPSEIQVLSKEKFRCITDESNHPTYYEYDKGDGKSDRLELYNIVHFRLWSPDSLIWGLSPMEVARMSVEQDYDASQYNAAFFKNSAIPSGIVKFPQGEVVTNEMWDTFRSRWNSMYQGADKAFKLAALTGGGDFTQIGLTHKDMLFLEQKKWSREEIAAVFKVPPSELGIFEHVQKAVGNDVAKGFWQKTLIPRMALIQATLDAQLFGPYNKGNTNGIRVEYDLSTVEPLQEDLNEKLTQAERLQRLGFSANAINEKLELGMESYEGGDVNYIPAGVMIAGTTPPSQVAADIALEASKNPPPEPEPPEEPEEEPEKPPKDEDEEPAEDEDEDADKAQKPLKTRALDVGDGLPHTPIERIAWQHWKANTFKGEKAFEGQIRKYLSDMTSWVTAQIASATPEDLTPAMILLSSEWDDRLMALGAEYYEKMAGIMKPSIERKLADIGLNYEWNTVNPKVVDFMKTHVPKLTRVNDTIRQATQNVIVDGLNDLKTVKEIAEDIEATIGFSKGRSKLIARTETGQAANGYTWIAYEEVGVKTKMWLAALDEKTRDTHIDAMIEGSIPFDQPFASNGLMRPHDPSAGPEEVCNCRCDIIATG